MKSLIIKQIFWKKKSVSKFLAISFSNSLKWERQKVQN